MNEVNLMPIGRFSRGCRLSIKALRYYDQQGLLKPAAVDTQTGYRYYAPSQARDAVMIAMLRSLDVPVARIKSLLHAQGPDLRTQLRHEQQRVEREIARKAQALRSFERIARHGDLIPYDVSVRTEPPHTVMRRSISTKAESMVDDSSDLICQLIDELAVAGRKTGYPVMCINEDPGGDESIVVHGCVGVQRPWPELPSAEVVELRATTVAWLVHRGAYEELGLSYHALFAWAQGHGHEQAGAVREIYLNDPADTEVADLLTEVLLPIAT